MEWFPHPLPAYTRHWTTFICCGWAHGSIIMPLPTHVSTQMLEVPWNSTSLLGDKGWHCAVVEALTQYGVDPTSPPNIWKVFDNFHILLMGTWNLHHVTTTTCVRPDVGSPIKSCITPGLQRIPLCSGWGSYPRWKESHIPSQHMKGVWKPSYAVDGHMDLS